ncbi:MAG: hypothetical protein ACYS5W_24925 [Planctomycetota bacterium]|jgi:hypothetical protein
MQRLLWLIPTVALSTTLLAQSVVSPKGFGAVEGAGFAHIFGRYAEGRFQFAEGDLRAGSGRRSRSRLAKPTTPWSTSSGTGMR